MTVLRPIEMYRAATAGALDVTKNIRPDQLVRPTRCDAWTVQDRLLRALGRKP